MDGSRLLVRAAYESVEMPDRLCVSFASSDQVTLVVDAGGMVAERLGVLVQVGDPIEHGGYGGCWTWVTGKCWWGDVARSGDDRLTTEGDVELVGVVKGSMEPFCPGVGSTDTSGGGYWWSAA